MNLYVSFLQSIKTNVRTFLFLFMSQTGPFLSSYVEDKQPLRSQVSRRSTVIMYPFTLILSETVTYFRKNVINLPFCIHYILMISFFVGENLRPKNIRSYDCRRGQPVQVEAWVSYNPIVHLKRWTMSLPESPFAPR